MSDTVKIYIDDKEYVVPAGINLVDAAKWIGNDIPVFCYHPKMEPVGMCRMCLVEMGSIVRDRATNEVQLDDKGNPQVRWFPKLQTACTNKVSEGLVIRTTTPAVQNARRDVVEFLLTSHPLDCPICDKGGECPLQNLTMRHGSGTSRMVLADKLKLDKHVPLGDLIFLDEERCIQCARCVRFQDEVVGDPVLAFHERGRKLQIITNSTPGFDTYFSGNTTDICPVGALTTADFRFGARPWELTEMPSICPHCPVGCNLSLTTRLDRDFGGRAMIKRVMPRQNEEVNEIWICDKGRFGHHFSRSIERLTQPMVRGANGTLREASWSEALQAAKAALQAAGGDVAAIAGGMASNEDLLALKQLVAGLGSDRLGAWPPSHAGADLVTQVGVGKGTNLGTLGKGDAVLIIASDLEEEAPVWRLRLKQAKNRGTYVVVANARPTRMDDFATAKVHYGMGEAAAFMNGLRANNVELAEKLAGASNLVIVAGAEGLTLEGSRALMQAAANFLIETGHVGKANNGLMATFPGSNGMGLYYMGFTPEQSAQIAQKPPKALIVAQADVLKDDSTTAGLIDRADKVIALSMFLDDTAQQADVVLPIQSFAERDGTFTNGERRVQRFYTAQGPMGESVPLWQAVSRLGELLGQGRARTSAAVVWQEAVKSMPIFAGMSYTELGKVERQFPDVGSTDLYYGGTAYKNRGGLGIQVATAADRGEAVSAQPVTVTPAPVASGNQLLIVPTQRLYNRERTFEPSTLMHGRIPDPYIEINSADAQKMGIKSGDMVAVAVSDGPAVNVRAHVDGVTPQGAAILPRHLSAHATPIALTLGAISKVEG